MRNPTDKTPEDYGWILIDNNYHYYWFDGPQSPSLDQLSSTEGIVFIIFKILISNVTILIYIILLLLLQNLNSLILIILKIALT